MPAHEDNNSNNSSSPSGKNKRTGRYRNARVDRAAGGLVLHEGRVLVVHRPHYDDWSLPKGHVKNGETWEQTALREVHEETGVSAEIVGEPFPVSYLVADNRPKVVIFFAMRCVSDPDNLSGDPAEVDEAQWWSVEQAREQLSYVVEVEVLDALLGPQPHDRHRKR